MNKENKNLYINVLVLLIIIGFIYIIFPKSKDKTIENKVIDNKIDTAVSTTSTDINNLNSNNKEINNNLIKKNKMHKITLDTNKGSIVFETYDADAPKTVENFIKLANKNYYNGVIFHRVIKGFMIQGGDPTGTGMGGPGYTFEDELNPATISYKTGYKRGVVAMANAGPNTNGSQFFIMHKDNPLPNNYTIFGNVISGIETVDAIANTNTDPNDRPLEKIIINKVLIEESK